MKTKFLKFVLPIAFVAFGLIGAFSTNAMEKEMADSGAVPGYRKISANTCEITSTSCDEVHNFLCKTPGNVQLYKQIAPNVCPDMLWRSTQ
jgi:hypothetical protein